LATGYAGTDRALPKTGPKAVKGKTVWILSCAESAPGCAIPAKGALQAAKAIGWNAKVVDGKFDPATYNQQVRAAVAAKVDAIVFVVVDCVAVEGSLKAAKSAGIKTYALGSLDCDDKYANGTKQFDGAVSYGSRSYADFLEQDLGPAIADYTAASDPKAKIIELQEQDAAVIHHIGDGYDAAIKANCPGCTVYRKLFTGADLVANKLQAMTAALLTQHPDATVVMAPYDATILLGIGAAVQQAKAQSRKLLLTGLEGLPPNIGLIKSGEQDMAAGVPGRWLGWAAIDGLNRVFAGSPQVDPGIGYQIITKDKNLPTGPNGYDGNAKSAGYSTNYQRIWTGR
jgi:ribose transport system substrate-binding protein